MARKSNKTSHVLNLLAGDEPLPGDSTAAPSGKSKQAPPQPDSAPAPEIEIVDQSGENDPVAGLIKDSLEAAVESIDAAQPVLEPDITPAPTEAQPIAAPVSAQPVAAQSAGRLTHAQISLQESSSIAAADLEPESEFLLVPDEPEPQPEPVRLAAASPQVPIQSAVPVTTDAPEPLPIPQTEPTPAAPEPASAPAASEPESTPESTYQFTNVMEHVVREIVEDYMTKFDMCTCPRCVTDTTALTLTTLPAKYIVVSKNAVSPLLNYYSNKYIGMITVELTKACITVNDQPHHDR